MTMGAREEGDREKDKGGIRPTDVLEMGRETAWTGPREREGKRWE